jgi:hypothetical protein
MKRFREVRFNEIAELKAAIFSSRLMRNLRRSNFLLPVPRPYGRGYPMSVTSPSDPNELERRNGKMYSSLH